MDGHRFDDLTRALAGASSRRGLLKGGLIALGAALGSAFGLEATDAAACRKAGRLCREHTNCCSGICATDGNGRKRCACPDGLVACNGACVDAAAFQTDPKHCGGCGNRCPSGVCADGQCQVVGCLIGGQSYAAGALNPSNPCQSCQPKLSTSAWSDAADGTKCEDGDLCTVGTTCKGGACGGGKPVVCTPLDNCHYAGKCDPATGDCSNPVVSDYRACTDSISCATGGTCIGGVCQAGLVNCNDDDPCTVDSCVNGQCVFEDAGGCGDI